MLKVLLEDNKNESGDSGPEQSKSSKRNAVIAGVSVASGAILLATLMIGGTLLATNGSSGMYSSKVEKILKGSLDSIPSPSVRIQTMSLKVCLRCKGKTLHGIVSKLLKTKIVLTSPSNVLPYYLPQVNFPANNLNFH